MEQSINQVVRQELDELINILLDAIRSVINRISAWLSRPKPPRFQFIFMNLPASATRRTLSESKTSKRCHRRSNIINIGPTSDIVRNIQVGQSEQQILILTPPTLPLPPLPTKPRQDEPIDDTAVLDKPAAVTTESSMKFVQNETAKVVPTANDLDTKVLVVKPEVVKSTAVLDKTTAVPTERKMKLVQNETAKVVPTASDLDTKVLVVKPEVVKSTAVLDKTTVTTQLHMNLPQNATTKEVPTTNVLDTKVSVMKPVVVKTPPAIMQKQEPPLPIIQQDANQPEVKPLSPPKSEVPVEQNKKPVPSQTRKRSVQPSKITNKNITAKKQNPVQAKPRWR